MRVVLQRVLDASVSIDNKIVGSIAHGFLLFVGITHTDTKEIVDWMVEKIMNLRVFEDAEGKMNTAITDVSGSLLIISQFTLYGDCQKGTRPGFTDAARPDVALPLYQYMIESFRQKGIVVETGEFGAHMVVSSRNDGPATFVIEK